jgi:peptide/nickel transport system permease protein
MADYQRKTSKLKEFLQLLFSNPMGFGGVAIITLFLFMAIFAPFLGTVDPSASGDVDNLLISPSPQFWFGTDDLARDIWSQTIYGSRISLMIGFVAAVITVVTGSIVGLMAGYYGKMVDEVFMRIVDFFMMLPELPLMIVLAAVMGPSMWNIILVVSLVSWPRTARIVRSQVLSIKERPFVESSRCIGASNFQLMFAEILPNVVPLMFAQAVLMITEAIYAEAVLSFLGLGDPTSISWGMMLHSVFESGVIAESYWWVAPPIVCIVVLIVSFSLLGTAISDVLEPGYREKKGY